MKIKLLVSAALCCSFLVSSVSMAQTPAPTPAAPAAAEPSMAKPKMTAEEKAAKSKECSDEADAKGLKGKERKKFRSACKHGKETK